MFSVAVAASATVCVCGDESFVIDGGGGDGAAAVVVVVAAAATAVLNCDSC